MVYDATWKFQRKQQLTEKNNYEKEAEKDL